MCKDKKTDKKMIIFYEDTIYILKNITSIRIWANGCVDKGSLIFELEDGRQVDIYFHVDVGHAWRHIKDALVRDRKTIDMDELLKEN